MRRLFAVTGFAVLLMGCGEEKPAAVSTTNAATLPATSSGAAARPMEANKDSSVELTGPIIVEHQIDLTAQRDGVVSKIFFDAPTRVKAGTLLAQLDDRQLVANLEAARAKTRGIDADLKNWKAEAEVLKADYARAQNLWDLKLISEEQLQHAQYKAESEQWDIKRVGESLNMAREEERSLELELEKTKITSPFDAVLARRYAHEGQSVAKGDRLFWVTAEAPLLLRITLPERFFGHIKAGQMIDVHCPNVPAEKHVSRVKQVSPVVDPSSGTFEVLVELVGDHGSLHPGMTAAVRVDDPR